MAFDVVKQGFYKCIKLEAWIFPFFHFNFFFNLIESFKSILRIPFFLFDFTFHLSGKNKVWRNKLIDDLQKFFESYCDLLWNETLCFILSLPLKHIWQLQLILKIRVSEVLLYAIFITSFNLCEVNGNGYYSLNSIREEVWIQMCCYFEWLWEGGDGAVLHPLNYFMVAPLYYYTV